MLTSHQQFVIMYMEQYIAAVNSGHNIRLFHRGDLLMQNTEYYYQGYGCQYWYCEHQYHTCMGTLLHDIVCAQWVC